MTKASKSATPLTHKHLELIRRLQAQSFIFSGNPKTATEQAQQQSGSPFDKLVYRATLIDSDKQLLNALQKSEFLFGAASKLYSASYFLLGFFGVFGLLNTQLVSFFYVLIGLLGWHSLTLLLWLIGLKKRPSYASIYLLLDKLTPKKAPEKTAFAIYLDEFKRHDTWRLGLIVHRAWLFGLLGSLLALLLLFLFKSYAFVWESTLLSEQHFQQMLSIFAAIPSMFGVNVPVHIYPLSDETAANLAILIMAGVAIYGLLPRFLAYLYCFAKAKNTFEIDQNLPYYQTLLKQFNQQIIDQDDFCAQPIKKISAAQLTTDKKIIATLEHAANKNWHHAKIAEHSQDIGTLDTSDDINNAIALANSSKAQLYLGISPKLLPDRGVLRKFDMLIHGMHYGLVVQFIGDGDHLQAWQQALIDRDVPQVENT